MILSKDSGVDARFVLSDLFDRSIIGNISPHNNFVKFKHRISNRDINNYKWLCCTNLPLDAYSAI